MPSTLLTGGESGASPQDRGWLRLRRPEGPSALDTNMRSWSDGVVANACSGDSWLGISARGSTLVAEYRPAARRGDHRGSRPVRGGSGSAGFRPDRPSEFPDTHTGSHSLRPQRVVCAGPTDRQDAAARRRIRILLGSVVVALVVALALPWGGAGGRPLATPGPARAGDAVASHSLYVVQPGDTLWTIAERLVPSGDPRPVVAQLASEIGGDTVVPGERLVLP